MGRLSRCCPCNEVTHHVLCFVFLLTTHSPRNTCVVASVGSGAHLWVWGGQGILSDGLIRCMHIFKGDQDTVTGKKGR